jgi:hypothetical protein
MPWLQTSPVEQRIRFIDDALIDGLHDVLSPRLLRTRNIAALSVTRTQALIIARLVPGDR